LKSGGCEPSPAKIDGDEARKSLIFTSEAAIDDDDAESRRSGNEKAESTKFDDNEARFLTT